MYNVEIQTREDKILGRGPFTMSDIKNLSVTSARVIIVDSTNHQYMFRKDEIINMEIWPKKGE